MPIKRSGARTLSQLSAHETFSSHAINRIRHTFARRQDHFTSTHNSSVLHTCKCLPPCSISSWLARSPCKIGHPNIYMLHQLQNLTNQFTINVLSFKHRNGQPYLFRVRKTTVHCPVKSMSRYLLLRCDQPGPVSVLIPCAHDTKRN